VQSQADLLQVVLARDALARFPDSLDRRQQQPHAHADDGDDDEQFN
jgi:hypothetical protein